ncbi:hypothetical protein AB0D78_03345 [Streptomyces avermitilis]|uniref:hypothetical protein n=1 Tax=Streptomyces avermitilis TaxID=33903 RepID=UPI00340341B1
MECRSRRGTVTVTVEALKLPLDLAAGSAVAVPGAAPSGQSADDRDEELKRLRKLTAEQAKTIEILKKATAFFAKESDR